MSYETPQPGDYGLTTIDGPVGWGIHAGQRLLGAKRTASGYEHTFLILDNGELIEAQPGGAVIRSLTEYDQRQVLYVSPEITDDQRHAIVTAGRRYAGTPYSAADYFALAAHRFHLPLPWLRRYVASSKHMICSQLVDQCYRDAGVQLFADGRWPGYVAPADLYPRRG